MYASNGLVISTQHDSVFFTQVQRIFNSNMIIMQYCRRIIDLLLIDYRFQLNLLPKVFGQFQESD